MEFSKLLSFEVGQHLRPTPFRLSDDDCVGALNGFFREECGMDATEDDLGALSR